MEPWTPEQRRRHAFDHGRIDDMTALSALSAGYDLMIECSGCCGSRAADLKALAARQPHTPLRKLVFRCTATRWDGTVCQSVGRPAVSGPTGLGGGARRYWR